MDNGDIALSNAIIEIWNSTPNESLFLEKCQYHEKMMEKFLGDRSPMIMAETEAGKKELSVIASKVKKLMTEKYG